MKQTKSSRPTFIEEQTLWDNGFEYIIGIDEVGRGSFAGPLVVAGVIFKKDCIKNAPQNFLKVVTEINDSKLLTPQKRTEISKEIFKHVVDFAIVEINVPTINRIGIGRATYMGMRKIVIKLAKEKSFILIDGFTIKRIPKVGSNNQKGIIKGDQKKRIDCCCFYNC